MKSLFKKSDIVGAVGKAGADRCLQNAFALLEQNARIRQLLCLKIEPWGGFKMRPEHTVQRAWTDVIPFGKIIQVMDRCKIPVDIIQNAPQKRRHGKHIGVSFQIASQNIQHLHCQIQLTVRPALLACQADRMIDRKQSFPILGAR